MRAEQIFINRDYQINLMEERSRNIADTVIDAHSQLTYGFATHFMKPCYGVQTRLPFESPILVQRMQLRLPTIDFEIGFAASKCNYNPKGNASNPKEHETLQLFPHYRA